MSVRHPTLSSGGNTYIESVVSVVDDLISDRAIWRKVVCIVLCLVFLLNAWAVIVLHMVNFTNETVLEVSVSVAVLIVGQYVGTGIVDGYLYWRRWSKTSHKSHSREQEENKEAWVCMRITLSLLGMAPVSRYIDSLVVVRRMVSLEKQYLSEAVAFAKEVKQPSNLPSGSLISAPTMSAKQSASIKSSNTNQPMSASRLRALDAGLVRVYKVRRQFRRTEQDAALVALANGVVGAGPFVISQGVLYFRRVGLNYPMALTTMLGILSCSVTGLVWLCAGLTHFHPAAFDQSEVDFERGIGQVSIGGLILLFFTHLVHVTLRSGCLMLFTAQFYWIVLGVLGFHLLFVLLCLIVARVCTREDYSNPSQVNRSSISGNLLSDIMFSYVGLFEFANAYAKYTRTRYFLYYLFYYLENAAMIGAWYVHFTYPQVWYYLPALLVITVAQLLGFILLQVYLYFFSRSRRKTTLCGLCFAHKDPNSHVHFQSAHTDQPDLAGSLRRFESLHTPSALGLPATSVLSGRSGTSQGVLKRSASGLYDPVFGQQIAQTAVPKTQSQSSKMRRPPSTGAHMGTRSVQNSMHSPSLVSATRPVDKPTRTTVGTNREQTKRMYKQYSRHVNDLSNENELVPEPAPILNQATPLLLRHSSSNLLPISAEEAIEREIGKYTTRERHPPHGQHRQRDHNPLGSSTEVLTRELERPNQRSIHPTQKPPLSRPTSAAVVSRPNSGEPPKGVFQPRPDQNYYRNKWPYAAKMQR
ncbi:hypothetical protein EG68_04474 [Paragonimus skrjabini miyazakii]|uniref:XK-related protein n=1 Tax=Paragonimus skrjabini miyazakii TaxID=59628 RepID=A0A8S9YUL2_9TREM|nr:hypothetical protein EG68_04474 [Paragonimus skrjabini miyazakii]